MTDQQKQFLEELLSTFRSEAKEHLQDIMSLLVGLERATVDRQGEFAGSLLKRLHTLKGAARAVGLLDLETLCHILESIFSPVLRTPALLDPEHFDCLHQASALALALIQEPSGRVRNQAKALNRKLEHIAGVLSQDTEHTAAHDAPHQAVESTPGATQWPADPLAAPAQDRRHSPAPSATSRHASGAETEQRDLLRVQAKDLEAIRSQIEALLSIQLQMEHQIEQFSVLTDQLGKLRTDQEVEVNPPVTRLPALPAGGNRGSAAVKAAEPEVRQLTRHCHLLATAMASTHRTFHTIRTSLIEASLQTALAPFATAVGALPGLVRNLSRTQGKEVVLRVSGNDTLIDRRVLDMLGDVLIHLVSNAVDHGIESAATRLSLGKEPLGAVQIDALLHGASHVVVIVSDDGAGIDMAAVMASATNSAALDATAMATMNDRDKLHLALLPGVSTRSNVTLVSGRGVGLAIVADRVTALGGSLTIESRAGGGCAFRMLLPVRLSTLQGIVVRVAHNHYVLPMACVEQVRAIAADAIDIIEQRETLFIGQRAMPVVRLGRLFGLDSGVAGAQPGKAALIVQTTSASCALVVDEIVGVQEVLPKQLPRQLRKIRWVSGAAQLGDGKLAAILNPEAVLQSGLTQTVRANQEVPQQRAEHTSKRVLVAEDSITSRLLLKYILEGAGYQVETAVDGLDALSKLRLGQFDALVTDIEMPRLDGLQLTAQLRKTPATAALPIVLVTSLHTSEQKNQGLHAGADAYVIKGSFDQDNLLATLLRLI